jgi:hypothetical protein
MLPGKKDLQEFTVPEGHERLGVIPVVTDY